LPPSLPLLQALQALAFLAFFHGELIKTTIFDAMFSSFSKTCRP
jgi:hypothetical protein